MGTFVMDQEELYKGYTYLYIKDQIIWMIILFRWWSESYVDDELNLMSNGGLYYGWIRTFIKECLTWGMNSLF